MKSIKEKQILVKWAKAMNEPIDPALVEEVERYEKLQKDIIESVRSNTLKDLTEASVVAEQLIERVNVEYPKPPTLDEVLDILKEEQDELVQAQTAQTSSVAEKAPTSSTPTDLISQAVVQIAKEVKNEEASFQQPQPTLADKNFEAVQKKLKFLEQAIGKIAATGPGGGAVWLRELNDVDYNSVRTPSDSDVLTFNASTGKWEAAAATGGSGTTPTLHQVTNRGNVTTNGITVNNANVNFLAVNTAAGFTVTEGQIAWNAADLTFDMGMSNGVTLQVGQEQYIKVKAANAITNGYAVMFAGANGEHILATHCDLNSPGFRPEYFIGVATQDIAKNGFGYITTFGKVHDVNTLAYQVGDILYADPNNIGGFTTTEPAAPNINIMVAAVTKRAGGDGHIMVRPLARSRIAELNDVTLSTPTHGQSLVFDGGNVWRNQWLTTANVVELTNLFFTNARAVSAVTAAGITSLNNNGYALALASDGKVSITGNVFNTGTNPATVWSTESVTNYWRSPTGGGPGQPLNSSIKVDSSGATIRLDTGLLGLGTIREWVYDHNGHITFPDSTVQLTAFNNTAVYSNVTQLGYITGTSLNGYATNSQVSGVATTANLALNTANTANAKFDVLITPNEYVKRRFYYSDCIRATPPLGSYFSSGNSLEYNVYYNYNTAEGVQLDGLLNYLISLGPDNLEIEVYGYYNISNQPYYGRGIIPNTDWGYYGTVSGNINQFWFSPNYLDTVPSSGQNILIQKIAITASYDNNESFKIGSSGLTANNYGFVFNTNTANASLTFPDGTIQTTAYTGSSLSSYIDSAYNQANTATVAAYAAFDKANTGITNSALSGYATNAQLSSYATTSNLALKANIVDLTTANVTEVTNLYYTNARVYANVITLGYAKTTSLTTSNVTEVTNLYHTNARVYANVTAAAITIGTTTINIGSSVTQLVNLSGGVGSITANNVQTLRVSSGGISVIGNSYFSDSIGIGTNLNVVGTIDSTTTGVNILPSPLGINAFGSATQLGIGATTGTTTVNNDLALGTNKNITLTGNITTTKNITSGNISVTGQANVVYTPASVQGTAFNITAANTKGGTGYADVIQLINASGGATNPNKFIRISQSGALEIINSAYNSRPLELTDNGDLNLTGNVTGTGVKFGYSSGRPGFRVYGAGTTNNLSTTQNTTGALNGNNWDIDFNQGSYLNDSTGVFTAPVAGLYQINVVGRNAGNASISQLAAVKNASGGTGSGGSVMCMLEFGGSSSMNHAGVGVVVQLAVGDTLALKVLAGTINFDSNDNWSVAYLG